MTLRRRPRIGLLISGDELVASGTPRGPGQIWESNGTLLEALLERLGHEVSERRVVGDQPAALRAALTELAARNDVVVSTGGVSAGDSDWIRPLLEELGSVSFWKLFLKPGRPFAFGTLGGSPFSACRAIRWRRPSRRCSCSGRPCRPSKAQNLSPCPDCGCGWKNRLNRGSGRPELARARLAVASDGSLLALVEGSQASSRIGSLQGADLLLEIPAEAGSLAAGTELWAQLLRLPIL